MSNQPSLSSDSAVPVVDRNPRCWRCQKKLANYLTRPVGQQLRPVQGQERAARLALSPAPSHEPGCTRGEGARRDRCYGARHHAPH